MPILKEVSTPGGAKIAWHCAKKIDHATDDPNGFATITVHSWPTLDDYIANNGIRFTQVSHISVPAAVITSLGLEALERAVISNPESILYGGSIAPLPDGMLLQKALLWAVVKQTREFRAQAPIEFGGHVFDADAKSVANIQGAIQGMEIRGSTEIDWTLADNTVRTVSLEELRQLGAAIMERVDACYQRAREIRAEIDAVTTLEQLAAITW